MTYKFVIHGRLDGLNEYTAANRRNPYSGGESKKKNQTIAINYIRSQLRNTRITKPVRMHYVWYEKNCRRDLDNVSSFGRKVIQDALVKCKVLQGDGWKHIVGFSDEFYCDKENPRIEVTIEEID